MVLMDYVFTKLGLVPEAVRECLRGADEFFESNPSITKCRVTAQFGSEDDMEFGDDWSKIPQLDGGGGGDFQGQHQAQDGQIQVCFFPLDLFCVFYSY